MSKDLALKPRLSEKTYALSQDPVVYVFDVPKNASKQMISRAVKDQFDVTVVNVNVLNAKGKTKFAYRKGYRAMKGQRGDVKKAYITLKDGDTLPIYAAVEKAEKEAQAAEAKTAAKKAKEEK